MLGNIASFLGRSIAMALGGLICLGLLGVSIAMNWRFGMTLATAEFDQHLYGFASACADGFKALAPFFIYAAWRNSRYLPMIVGLVLWVVFTGYSFTSSIGFSALNRADTTQARDKLSKDYRTHKEDAELVRSQRQRLGAARTVAEVQADMETSRRHRRWRSSKQCTNATASKSRKFCDAYGELKKEFAKAREAVRLDGELDKLRIAAARFQGVDTSGAVDPQARIIGTMLSVKELGQVQNGLIILIAVLVELGSGLGFFVVFGQASATGQAKTTVSEPENAISGGALGLVEPVARVEPANVAPGSVGKPTSLAEPALDWPRLAIDAANEPGGQRPSDPVDVVGSGPGPGPVQDLDTLEWFVVENLIMRPDDWEAAQDVYQAYISFCESNGRIPMSLASFGGSLSDMGLQKARMGGRVRYLGIKLKPRVTMLLEHRAS